MFAAAKYDNNQITEYGQNIKPNQIKQFSLSKF